MKGKSCTTAVIYIVEDLRSKLNGNSVLFLDLLDQDQSFDTVDHMVLLKKFWKLFYFSNFACNLIYFYLLNRFQKVNFNGNILDPFNISRGIPQGYILGLLLFCMYINYLSTRCFGSL